MDDNISEELLNGKKTAFLNVASQSDLARLFLELVKGVGTNMPPVSPGTDNHLITLSTLSALPLVWNFY